MSEGESIRILFRECYGDSAATEFFADGVADEFRPVGVELLQTEINQRDEWVGNPYGDHSTIRFPDYSAFHGDVIVSVYTPRQGFGGNRQKYF